MLTHDVNLVFVREVQKSGLRDTSNRNLIRPRTTTTPRSNGYRRVALGEP